MKVNASFMVEIKGEEYDVKFTAEVIQADPDVGLMSPEVEDVTEITEVEDLSTGEILDKDNYPIPAEDFYTIYKDEMDAAVMSAMSSENEEEDAAFAVDEDEEYVNGSSDSDEEDSEEDSEISFDERQ